MTDEPRPAELMRLYNELSVRVADGFHKIELRLDRMPTNDILLAYLATRDQEMKTNGDDIKELTAAIADERNERKAADKDVESRLNEKIAALEDRLQKGRTLAWSITGVVSAIILGGGGYIVTALGGGA